MRDATNGTRSGTPKPSQIPLDFDSLIAESEVLSRSDIEAALRSPDAYSPIDQTAGYMQRAVDMERGWESTLAKAREALLTTDPRSLYFDFITDLSRRIREDPERASQFASILREVAVRGLGMSPGYGKHLAVHGPRKGNTKWSVYLDQHAVRNHIGRHVKGAHFLNVLSPVDSHWKDHHPVIAASDVSQHRSKIPIPSRAFKRSVPFVLNNAAGVFFSRMNGDRPYENVFNPKPDEELLRWMLIDPSYQDQLDPEDYLRCTASAMDVGQYKFDLEYLLKTDRRTPDVIFRDGSLFPQDAYLDNYVIENKRGEFTREAIRELMNCLSLSASLGSLYCGVSKSVELRVFSTVVDWFISTHIESSWPFGSRSYTMNDGEAMSFLLSSSQFVADNLESVLSTCLIRRSFTTRAGLNEKINLDQISSHMDLRQQSHRDVDLTYYRRLCEKGHLFMFFIGHSKSPQQQLPRYEFFDQEENADPLNLARIILAAIRECGLAGDQDHSYMSDEPVTYILPVVTQQAHALSKDVGRLIDRTTGQQIMARFRARMEPQG